MSRGGNSGGRSSSNSSSSKSSSSASSGRTAQASPSKTTPSTAPSRSPALSAPATATPARPAAAPASAGNSQPVSRAQVSQYTSLMQTTPSANRPVSVTSAPSSPPNKTPAASALATPAAATPARPAAAPSSAGNSQPVSRAQVSQYTSSMQTKPSANRPASVTSAPSSPPNKTPAASARTTPAAATPARPAAAPASSGKRQPVSRAQVSQYTSSMQTVALTRGAATKFVSDMGNAPSAPTNRNTVSAYQTLWSSMVHTGVTGIGGSMDSEARLRQEAALAQIRGAPNTTTFEAAAVVAGGNITTREKMVALGIPTVNRVAIMTGFQSASYELRYSSVAGLQLRISFDTDPSYGAANLRTRVTFSQGANGEWVRMSGDIGANIQPPRQTKTPSKVSSFVGLRFADEGISATSSASATVRTPAGTAHGGSVSVTSPILRYDSVLPERNNPIQNGGPSQLSMASTTFPNRGMTAAESLAAAAEISGYLRSLR